MTTSDSVDVVIPAWGTYVDHLARATKSVAAGARIIAVVDPVDEQRARRLGCHVIVHRPSGGVGAARQAGYAASSRPYILFLDADDQLLPGMLELMVGDLARLPARYVAVTMSLRRRSDHSRWPPTRLAQLACLPGCGPFLLYRNVVPAVGACLIRRSRIPAGPLFPDKEDEDWHAIVRLRASGRIKFTPTFALDYNDAVGTVSRRTRDATAVQDSHNALLTGVDGPHRWWWELVEAVVRRPRQRNDVLFLEYWR